MDGQPLAWGILSTGRIAGAFARGLAHSRRGRLVAVGSRSQESAERFGEQHNVPSRHGSYEALLADPQVQAIYIATPHPLHAEWTIKGAAAGKHILCEKPIGMNHAEAMAIIEAARKHDVFLMEAFMYRCHPQTARLVEMIRSGVIGQVKLIQATFGFNAAFSETGRAWANELGGGGILDVGCYPASMSRLIAGVATGRDFADPVEVKGSGQLHPKTGVDEYAIATLRFPGGILAQLATGVGLALENVVRIFGSEGHVLVPMPWIPAREGGSTRLIVTGGKDKAPQEITVETDQWLYGIEADLVAANIDRRQATSPAMSWDDTLGNMKTLDLWRAAIGLVYESEKLNAPAPTVSHRPLAVRKPNNMKYGQVAGVSKPISRLVMGVDNQPNMPHASVMFDDFFERGGNCFDTAYIYGGGNPERLLGAWVKKRGLRDQVTVIVKGAHTPMCDPANLTRQLLESLERQQSDYADIYIMHRDNPAVPVGEFVDVLNEHLRAGRIHCFGGSNWSLARIDEANAYAKKKGLAGFTVVSNNFSLARMVEPVWAGCIAASDPESRAWFKRTQTPLFAWSSQARGFFTERGEPAPGGTSGGGDAELVRCWHSQDNFRRRQRVLELAQKMGVLPINIALAYVLCQPFPTFALIGPRVLSETRTSLGALDVELSPEQLAWLNLEEEPVPAAR